MKVGIRNDGKATETLVSFITFCNLYPDLRFWQALCSWSGFTIFARDPEDQGGKVKDTFYWEGRVK